MTIEQIYQAKCRDNSDICQHLPTLKAYAQKCTTVVELGVRSIVSTWAFLAAVPYRLISVDIQHPSFYKDYDPHGCNLELVEKLAREQGTRFQFIQADSRSVLVPSCDLMFFDTLHTYEQLRDELGQHAYKVMKYMIFHDTETYKKELMPAIEEYLESHPQWMIDKVFTNNNGLLILQRG